MTVSSNDGLALKLCIWDEVLEPKGVLQLSHGMAEHIRRYEGLAAFLNSKGWIVAGHDHRGHGESVASIEDLGILAEEDGWTKLVDDLYLITQILKAQYADLPVFIMGHSMGSFALRHYLGLYGEAVKGAIICGTGQNPPLLNRLARALAVWEAKRKGRRHPSQLMTNLSFGKFNKAFAPNQTAFDWLSRDPVEVFKYIEDPLCGAVFSSGFYEDFLGGLLIVGEMAHIQKVPKHLPLLFISGSEDPLSNKGKAVERVANMHRQAGLSAVTVTIFEGARHELTNETNRQEVYEVIYDWLEHKFNSVHN